MRRAPLYGKYEETLDRESAYERLQKKAEEATKQAAEAEAGGGSLWDNIGMGGGGTGRRQGYGEAFTKSIVRTVASSVGRAIVGAILGGRRR